jgi:hypothetical protein
LPKCAPDRHLRGQHSNNWKHHHKIHKRKNNLSQKIEMMDFRDDNIHCIEITQDRANGILPLTQTTYITYIVHKFNFWDLKSALIPMECWSQLSAIDCPTTPDEVAAMELCHYKSADGSLMYLMTST